MEEGGTSAYGWCVSITAASAIPSLLTRKKPHPGTPAAPSCDVSHVSDTQGLRPAAAFIGSACGEATAAAGFGSSPSHNTGAPPPPPPPKPLALTK